MPENTVEFFPFHAINEFMRDDFRLTVVQSTLAALSSLDESYKTEIDKHVKKGIQIPGFRRADKAPNLLKAGPIAKNFEKDPAMVSAIVTAWAEHNAGLRQEVFDLLTSRGWELLPIDAQRSKLPGFMLKWPKSEDFETLYKAYQEAHPETTVSNDEVCLMAVWLGMRLPYEIVEESPADVSHEIFTEEAKKVIAEQEQKASE